MVRATRESGVTLIEVIVGVSVISALLVAIGLSITAYMDARENLLTRTKATYLAEEGYEIIRALRDNDWNTIDAITVDTVQYLDVSPASVGVGVSPEIIDSEYRRSFIVREVYRDANDDIVASTTAGATVDDGSREISVYVAGPAGTTTMQAILANVRAI